MLTISHEAYAGIELEAERRYLNRLVGWLRDKVPSLARENPVIMHVQCRTLMQQARSFGMDSEQAVAAYALTAALLGHDFADRFPVARKILFQPVPQERKIVLLRGITGLLLSTLAQR